MSGWFRDNPESRRLLAEETALLQTSEDRALRELAESATPGPWSAGGERCVWSEADVPDDLVVSDGPDGAGGVIQGDAAFIAAANPTAVLALLDEVERLRADADILRKQLGCDCGGVLVHTACKSRQNLVTVQEFAEVKATVARVEALAKSRSLLSCGCNHALRAALEQP